MKSNYVGDESAAETSARRAEQATASRGPLRPDLLFLAFTLPPIQGPAILIPAHYRTTVNSVAALHPTQSPFAP